MDIVTLALANSQAKKIEAEVAKLSPVSDPDTTGQIIRYLAGSGMVTASINSVLDPFAYYFDIDVDGNLNFTTDITQQALCWDKWANGISIYASIAGFYCPLYAAPFSSTAFLNGPAFQTNIIDLAPLGMTGYIGFLTLYPNSGGTGYSCVLYKWQVA